MEERLQKILAAAGVASRREAERMILAGRVAVDGVVINELGSKFDAAKCKITVDGNPLEAKEDKMYYIFNKPKGVVTTMKDEHGRKCIADYTQDLPVRVYPVGRLDFNTEGLLLLTNDGELAQALMHPSHEVGKTYVARVEGIVPREKLELLEKGVRLEDGMTAPAKVKLRSCDPGKKQTIFALTIHEGRNRQVRRMCDAIGHPVIELQRVQEGPLKLDNLPKGKLRELTVNELVALCREAKILKV